MTVVIPEPLKLARLLIVDDEEANVRLLQYALRHAGYEDVFWTTDGRQAAPMVEALHPDIVLLDLRMPHTDGFEVMQQIAPLVPAGSHLPILVLTADVTVEAKRRALACGATDFLTKPIDLIEVALRTRNLLQIRFLTQGLELQVRERTADLEAARVEIVERLAAAAEYRDDDTGLHTQRVGRTAALLARELGLPPDQVELIRQAAPLHDIGKIGIPDHILLKPGPLTDSEFETMKEHTVIGGRILSRARFPLLQTAERVALTHHERWDGFGYPAGLSGEAIPLVGRIVAVADVFDALTHARPYKRAWPPTEAAEEMRRQSGRQFDPAVIEVFLRLPWETFADERECVAPAKPAPAGEAALAAAQAACGGRVHAKS